MTRIEPPHVTFNHLALLQAHENLEVSSRTLPLWGLLARYALSRAGDDFDSISSIAFYLASRVQYDDEENFYLSVYHVARDWDY